MGKTNAGIEGSELVTVWDSGWFATIEDELIQQRESISGKKLAGEGDIFLVVRLCRLAVTFLNVVDIKWIWTVHDMSMRRLCWLRQVFLLDEQREARV